MTFRESDGIVQFALDGEPVGSPFDGYAIDRASAPVDLGLQYLKSGKRSLNRNPGTVEPDGLVRPPPGNRQRSNGR